MEVTGSPVWDVIIVGGGPAGLNAALLLGRCRRRVLLFDDGQARNATAHAAHAVFTRDGTPPMELRRIAREQLEPYGVVVRNDTVVQATRSDRAFEIRTTSGERHVSRKLLLATGVRDALPPIPGLAACYGRSVFTCPYCDGWEVRDQPLVALARGPGTLEFALGLTTWSRDLVLCTDGWTRLSSEEQRQLRAHAIAFRPDRLARLEHRAGKLERVIFADGQALSCSALFVHANSGQRSNLARDLGCEFSPTGAVKTRKLARAGAAGLYVAGDAAREVNFIDVAAAEGLKAAFAINKELRMEFSARQLGGAS
jgi:thioredoxin reductase